MKLDTLVRCRKACLFGAAPQDILRGDTCHTMLTMNTKIVFTFWKYSANWWLGVGYVKLDTLARCRKACSRQRVFR